MKASKIGPIMASMYESQEGGPPAIVREWGKKLTRSGEFLCLWGGAIKGTEGCLSWISFTVGLSDEGPPSAHGTDVPPANVERLLAPLAHEGRIKIMQALFDGPLGASELGDATGFRGGALYHHLKELQYAAYIKSQDGRYRLTQLGYQLLVTVSAMAKQAVVDEGERGLAVAKDWEDRE